jgi:TPR repeat protein
MSSPDRDDADEQFMHALPWMSDPQHEDETRRLQEDVAKAAQRLRESSRLASQARAQTSQQRTDIGLRLTEARSSEEDDGLEEMVRRVWAPLKPELMPPPPQEEMRLPSIGLVAGLLGAVGVAAAIALVIANVLQIPTINAAPPSDDEAGRNQSFSAAVLGRLPQIDAAQASVQPTEAPAAPTGPTLASIQTDVAPVATPPAAAPPAFPKVGPAQLDTMTQPTAVVPAPRAQVSLTRDEIAALLKRGQDLIAAGDIASARLMLTHLAEAGDAQASFILAGTFDAAVLAKLRVVGAQPDPEKARTWYARAAELGSLEAKQRLQSAIR